MIKQKKQNVSRWLSGKFVPSTKNIHSIAKALNVDVKELLYSEDCDECGKKNERKCNEDKKEKNEEINKKDFLSMKTEIKQLRRDIKNLKEKIDEVLVCSGKKM